MKHAAAPRTRTGIRTASLLATFAVLASSLVALAPATAAASITIKHSDISATVGDRSSAWTKANEGNEAGRYEIVPDSERGAVLELETVPGAAGVGTQARFLHYFGSGAYPAIDAPATVVGTDGVASIPLSGVVANPIGVDYTTSSYISMQIEIMYGQDKWTTVYQNAPASSDWNIAFSDPAAQWITSWELSDENGDSLLAKSGSATLDSITAMLESQNPRVISMGINKGRDSNTASAGLARIAGISFLGQNFTFLSAPSSPVITTAGLADGRDFTFSWTAPTLTGGSAVTGYSVALYQAGSTALLATATTATSSYTFTGNYSGEVYATVSAISAGGTSAASAASATVAVPPQAITVGQGGYTTVQSAIDAVAPGGTVSVPAGEYLGDIKIRDKSLTLVGIGAPGTVVLQQKPSGGEAKMIDLFNSKNVVIENVVVRGDASNPTKATGIDINSATNIILRNVSVEGLQKNGIAVNGQWRATSPLVSTNIVLDSVEAHDNAWAGIAFYTKNKEGTHSVGIDDVAFIGTTKISGGGAGIQFGDPGDSDSVTGLSSTEVILGTVEFAGVGGEELLLQDHSSLVIDRASTIDGRTVMSSDFEGAIAVVPLIATATSLTSSDSAVERRGQLALTATVTPAADGTITFRDGSTIIGEATVADGSASIVATLGALGARSLTASFAPDLAADFAASSSSAVAVNVVAPTAITVGQGGYSTITDAVAEIADGGTITVPAGSYDGTVVVTRPMVLVGADGHAAVLRGGIDVKADDVTIDGFAIDRVDNGAGIRLLSGSRTAVVNNTFAATDSHGVYGFSAAGDHLISGNAFQGGRGIVIEVASSVGSTISNNAFTTSVTGISTATVDSLVITGNTFSGFSEQAIGVRGANNVILGNHFDVVDGDVLDAAIYLKKSGTASLATGNAITGNTFTGDGLAILVAEGADALQGGVGASFASGNSFLGSGVAVENLDAAAFDASGNWWNDSDGAAAAQISGAVDTSGHLTPTFASVALSSTSVGNDTTSVTPSFTLVNGQAVSVSITGASSLAVGANTVTFTSTLTVNGNKYSDVRVLGVNRAAAPPVVIPPVVAPVTPPAATVEPPLDAPAPAPVTTAETIADAVGADTDALLERYQQANGGENPPAAAQVMTFPASSAPEADGSFLRDKAFTASVAWADTNGDRWVDVWAYSTPVFIGTFPVVEGVLQISGATLSALEAGGHHLVMIGQTSGKSQIVAIELADAPAAAAPGETPAPLPATDEPDSSVTAAGAEGTDDGALLVWLMVGLVLALLVAGAVVLAVRRRRA